MRTIKFSIQHLALLLLVLVVSSSMCLYWHRYDKAVLAALESRSGLKPKALTDLYPSWYGARELLLHRRDPYGVDVNRELQIAFYGKELDPSRPEERINQQRFVYPPYFIFFMAPLCWMQFHAAQTIFWWVQVACASFQLFLWLRFLRLELSQITLVALFALILTSIPVIQNLSILQPFLLAACFLAGAAVAVVNGRLFLAGTLLALATVKPQVCLLATAWFALWACSDWRHRRTFLLGFTTMLTALLLASEWLLPGWWREYPGALRAYAEYTKASTFLATLFPEPAVHGFLTVLIVTVVAVFCWKARSMPPGSTGFAVALSMVLTLTVCVVPAMVQPFNHVLLLPTVLLTIRHWKELRQNSFVVRASTLVFCISALLPWLLAAVAIGSPFVAHNSWFLEMWSVPLAASMALPFAAFGVLILLWKVTPLEATIPYGIDDST